MTNDQLTDIHARAQAQLQHQERIKDDIRAEARAEAGTTTLIAVAAFTVVSDPKKPAGTVIEAGRAFTVSNYDLDHYRGFGVPPAEGMEVIDPFVIG